jgi:predicted ATP-grasp superfamily ATP-dependent carboligase
MSIADVVQDRRAVEVSPRTTRAPVPVVVLNLFHSGLGIVRDFIGTGIYVIGLSAEKSCYGNHTRFCEVRFAPNSQREPDRLVEYLLSAAKDWDGAVIFPTRDADVVMLDKYRDLLSEHYRLALPPKPCLQKVLDKNVLAQIAESAGVPVPRTLLVRNSQELSRVANEVGFPCVVKPVSSLDWREGNNWELVGARKAFRAENERELHRGYTEVSVATSTVLAQEWIPGGTECIVVMAGYVNRQSEPAAFFTARKLLQVPADFGTGCAVASELIVELQQPTFRLWKTLRYHGMAEVEYKRDARSGEYKLIEINARHWDQHRLAGASGLNLSWIAYQDLIGTPLPPRHVPTARTTWIAEDVLAYHVIRGLYKSEVNLSHLFRLLRGPRMYGILSWKDPMPFLHQVGALSAGFIRALMATLLRRKPRNDQ